MTLSNLAPPLLVATAFLIAGQAGHAADDARVKVQIPQPKVWVGQRGSFLVVLEGIGPFTGAAGFSLPRVPQAVLVKVGNAVVSSSEQDGKSWFVQTHEFALFSQKAGKVQVPAFEVRFANRGEAGAPQDHVLRTPELSFDVEAPPDRIEQGFLVTTDKLEVQETWDPQPGDAKQGDVFRRTITQRADQMTGMALAPPVTTVSPGVRVHVSQPEVTDRTNRGEFSGTRRDVITYVLEQPGTFSVPAVRYVWWKPEAKTYGSTTLPAVTFQVAAIPQPDAATPAAAASPPWPLLLALPVTLAAIMLVWQRRRLRAACRSLVERLNPPDRVAARRLLRACQRNEPRDAESAWQDWRKTQPPDFTPSAPLQAALTELDRSLYGPPPMPRWQSAALARAFAAGLTATARPHHVPTGLPALNPH